MKNKLYKLIVVILTVFFVSPVLGQVFNKQKKTASYYDVETECLEDKLDGSFILNAWGKGSSKSEAIDQAKRNAERSGVPQMGEIIKEDPVDKRSRNNEFTLKTYKFPFQKMMPK